MQGNRKLDRRLVLAIVAAGLVWVMGPAASEAGIASVAGAALPETVQAGLEHQAGLAEKVIFHRRRPQELYCVEGRYWWYYRPYQNADSNTARCMPYFHYPDRSQGQYAPPGGLK